MIASDFANMTQDDSQSQDSSIGHIVVMMDILQSRESEGSVEAR